MEQNLTPKGCLLAFGLLAVATFIVYLVIQLTGSDQDCIRMAVDGSVKCKCDFKSSDAWTDFKESTKGLNHDGWEAVAVDGDPCKNTTAVSDNLSEKAEDKQSEYTAPPSQASTETITSETSTATNYDKNTIDAIIKDIKGKFYAIKYNTLEVDSIFANDTFEDDLTIGFRNENKEVVKIVSEIRGASIISATEYFYSNGALYFIYKHTNGTMTTDPYDSRSYVYNDQIIKIIENKVEVACQQYCTFDQDSEPYVLLKKYKKYKLE